MATGNDNKQAHAHDSSALPLNWSEAQWAVEVHVRSRRYAAELFDLQHTRRRTGGARSAQCFPGRHTMPAQDTWLIWRTSQTRSVRRHSGFTLIELLVVIGVIGILAGLLLPAIVGVKAKAKIKAVKSELSNLAAAISQYESEYSRAPISKPALTAALAVTAPGERDFTYGGQVAGPANNPLPISSYANLNYQADNAELMAMLQKENQTRIPALQDISRTYNPRQIQFFDAKRVTTGIAGIDDSSNVYHDSWGNPIFVTIDANDDGLVVDGLYGKANQNLNPPIAPGIRAPVAIWSAGPDGKVDPGAGPKESVNRDNITSWE